ncbi:unnamed protein product [Heligmosomoides polygyrus]|uniref:Uncharacterized protein n=1 Tax=Heligmosomoides polygyrus TaxID=6339 RepID=A0A183F9E5_HELPZ|nr:unnamed protein product [Heligmosomoides polygyrus]
MGTCGGCYRYSRSDHQAISWFWLRYFCNDCQLGGGYDGSATCGFKTSYSSRTDDTDVPSSVLFLRAITWL